MVDGSGGCRVDSRSPKIENEEKIKGKYSKRVICRAKEDDVEVKRKRKTGAFQ